jgi:PmbA protein
VDLASRAGFEHELRGLPKFGEIERRVERVRRDFNYLSSRYDGVVPNERVMLIPDLANRFFQHFLLQNLSMQAILNGTSSFTRGELEHRARRFHPDFTLVDVPTRDEHPHAFRLDRRGQSPVERPLIVNGCLVGTDVTLRAATQGQVAPTPTSLTRNWRLSHRFPHDLNHSGTDLAQTLSAMDNGVLIYSVLGLHTQDPSRGHYSLGVPLALVVRNHRIRGYVRGTLVGNFFQDLQEAPLALHDPLSELPILPLKATFIPGS